MITGPGYGQSVNWAHFPRSDPPTELTKKIVEVFRGHHDEINSEFKDLSSDKVLAVVANDLAKLGFKVERGKQKGEKVQVPVLYGNNGRIDKSFEADAHHVAEGFVIEVEAGRGVLNNQFLKDLFQACMMDGVQYLGIAVRNFYEPASSRDFDKVVTFMDTLFASNRLRLPLKGILVIGY